MTIRDFFRYVFTSGDLCSCQIYAYKNGLVRCRDGPIDIGVWGSGQDKILVLVQLSASKASVDENRPVVGDNVCGVSSGPSFF